MENWNKIEFISTFKLHVTPSELERLEFYRIQYLLKEYEEYVKRENEQYEKQNKEIEKQNKSMGSLNTPKFEAPKFNIPNIQVPKL